MVEWHPCQLRLLGDRSSRLEQAPWSDLSPEAKLAKL